MASVAKSPSYESLYADLNHYLTSDQIPTEEQEKFGTLNQEYQALAPNVFLLIQRGQVTPELTASLKKLEGIRDAIFGIRKSNIEGWKVKTIHEEYDADVVNAVSQQVLEEYAKKWGIPQERKE